jgi:hypothetical protein
MGYPPFQIPRVRQVTVADIDIIVDAMNRALMDIYRDKPTLTGTFTVTSGSQLTIKNGYVEGVK